MIALQEINKKTSENILSVANDPINSFDSLVKKIQNIVTMPFNALSNMFSKAALYFNGFNKPVEILSKVLFGLPSVIFYIAAKVLSLPFVGLRKAASHISKTDVEMVATDEQKRYWESKIHMSDPSEKEIMPKLINQLSANGLETSYDLVVIYVVRPPRSVIVFASHDGLYGQIRREGIKGVTEESIRNGTHRALVLLAPIDDRGNNMLQMSGFVELLPKEQPLLGKCTLEKLSLDEVRELRDDRALPKDRLEKIFSGR
jgi:hypothetical protein